MNKFIKNNEPFDFEKVYGSSYINKKEPGYYPILAKEKNTSSKTNFIFDSMFFYIQDRLSIDSIIKELSFSLVALFTYVFMHYSGRMVKLGDFGIIISFVLVAAMAYNFFKASLHSLAPGVICLVGGLVLLSSSIHQSYFKFISVNSIDYMIGAGAFFIALSLFKSERN